MKTLVTGGAGFIGSHVVDALRASGHGVTVIDSLDPGVWSGPPSYLRRDVRYVFQDLRHWTPDASFSDTEIVVHLAALGGVTRAAREPSNVLEGNVGGTARLVASMRSWPKLRHVVLASSFSVYGSNYSYRVPSTGRIISAMRRDADLRAGRFEVRDEVTGEDALIVPIEESAVPSPLELYGASKYMQELCFRGFDAAAVSILRFSSVYGDRLRLDDGEATIIARLAGWIRAGKSPTLFEDGNQIRDWVHVKDIVELLTRIIDGKVLPPLVVNVCSGQPTTLVEACAILNSVTASNVEPEIVGGFRPGDMRHCLGDASRFASLLGRDPLQFKDGARLAFANTEA